MGLKKLTERDIVRLKDSSVYLVRYFQDYLEELYAAYPDFPFPAGVIDSDPARQGRKEFHGRGFTVYGMERLRELPEGAALLITTGYYREEYEMLREALPSRMAEETIYYFANRDTEYYEHYLEKYDVEPLQDMIVFRSGMGTWEHVPGMDFTENARALFDYMLAEGYNRRYEMVWLVKDPTLYREVERQNANVRFASYDWATSADERERESYYRAVCLARYFFFTHACGFCRMPRSGQIRVQLWHGCGFKTVGNTVPQRHRYEYTTVVSHLYAGIHQEEFGLDPFQTVVTGYAKEDWLFHPVQDWRERLCVPEAGRYLFWLPTFRKAGGSLSYMDVGERKSWSGLPVLGTPEDLRKVSSLLLEGDTVLIIKLHPLLKREDVFAGVFPNIVVLENRVLGEADLHVNQILGHAAGLISDYSSAAIDFLLLDRPVAFTLDDLEEYRRGRGFVLNPIEEWIPGEKIFSPEDFCRVLRDMMDGRDTAAERRRELAGKLHEFCDGQNCSRIVKAFGL